MITAALLYAALSLLGTILAVALLRGGKATEGRHAQP